MAVQRHETDYLSPEPDQYDDDDDNHANVQTTETAVTEKGDDEEAIVKLYRGMKDYQLQFSFLPELLLSATVPLSSDSSSTLSPKSVFYGYDSEQTLDSTQTYDKGDSNPTPCGPDPVHTCPDCGKAYSTTSNLARHRQTHRSTDDKKARKCPHCDKLYVSSPAYSMHVRTHNQGCACPHCGKRFSRPWLLQGHIRTHTGEKPFECPKCGKTFADKSNLRAHIQTHSSEKPYVCGRCGKGFALKSYLYKHEESSCMRSHRLYHQTTSFQQHYHHQLTSAAEVF